MQLSVKRFTGENGERFCLLVDDSGMPLYYPSLFVTAEMRGSSLSINTIDNALSALKAMYLWQDYYGIDLESRFKRSELLLSHEIHSLRDFMQKPMAESRTGNSTVVSINGRQARVSKGNQYNRLTVIAQYIRFLATQLHPVSQSSGEAILSMVARIKANRPKIGNKVEKDRSDAHLDESLLDALEDNLRPGSESNPISDTGIQYRNALMFTLLRLTGMRRGELLNLRIDDFDFAMNTLKIVRRADSPDDPRGYQPLVKTRERTFPLIQELMDLIHEYVSKFRNKVPGSRKHGYLFVTHRAGPTQGWPISNSGFAKFLTTLSGIADDFSNVHAHALRHHWNYMFSQRSDKGGMSEERENKVRSYLMGWSETSGTAGTYNKRHIKEEAGKALVGLQNKHLGKSNDARK